MSPDLRYHIASLAGVFLALGIGILVGTAFVGAPVVDRQTRLIRRLEGNVADLRRETAERQEAEEALRILLPGALRGKLANRRVLVIQTGPYADAADEAADALRLSGATVARVILPADAWRRLGTATGEGATPAAAKPEEDRFAPVAAEARRIAPLLAAGANETLEDFRSRGLLTGDAILSGPARYAVVVGGGQAAPGGVAASPDEPWATILARSLDVPLAEALTARGVTVVGAEPFDAGLSFMRVYQSAGLATVDCVDRGVGKLALPFALLEERADYGTKPTAARLLPASLERASAEAVSASPTPAPPSAAP
jgi:hypothetical protein